MQDKSWSDYLKEGTEVDVLSFNGKVIGVQLPVMMSLKVSTASLHSSLRSFQTDPSLHTSDPALMRQNSWAFQRKEKEK